MGDVIVKLDEKDLILIAGLGIAYTVFKSDSTWNLPASASPFLNWIADATANNHLPSKLLARVLYQESRFRKDIINGDTKSSAGAVGIAQIVPRWHPDVNPLDPKESIFYAAKYLRKLYNRFGNWRDALAAYNWGQGNLSRFKSGEFKNMPRETMDYVMEIARDVGL